MAPVTVKANPRKRWRITMDLRVIGQPPAVTHHIVRGYTLSEALDRHENQVDPPISPTTSMDRAGERLQRFSMTIEPL